MLAVCSAAKPVVFKAPKPSSNTERVPQGTKPRAKPGHKKHSTSSKQPSVSSSEITKGGSSKSPTSSKTGNLKRKKESSLAMDSNPSHTLASTLVVAEMHQEDKQATGDPKSLRVTSEERANPQLSSGKGANYVARQVEQEEASRTIKLENLAKLMSHVQPSFKDLDSPEDDLIIVVDHSDENEEADKDKVHTTTNAETEDASVPKPSSPRSSQIQELTNQVLILQSQKHKLELEKNKAEAEAALLRAQPSFPNMGQLNEILLKELSSKFNELTKEVKGLKKQVHELEIKLPADLKEIPTKLEDFTKTAITSKKTNDESVPLVGPAGTQPAEGEKNTNQATISQGHIKKDKGKKAMSLEEAEKESTNNDSDDDETYITGSMVESSRIKKVKKFDFFTEGGKHIKKIEEDAKAEAAKRKSEVRKEELVDLIGPEVVNKYYNDKLQYDKYCDKMLNRRAKSRITNCDVLTKKGLITLKLYREDSTSEVIPNFKASDLHIGEWREDPLNKLNDLANKKRKHADDIHDYFKANKRLKSSVQYEDHPASTVLNEHVLALALQVLRRLRSIFTSVYVADQKLKKAYRKVSTVEDFPLLRYGLGLFLYMAPCAIKGVLRNELEEVKKEKDSIDFKIKKFENSAKDLDCLLGTQRSVKDKTGLPEFVDDTVTDYSRPTPSIDLSKDVSDEQKAIWKSNSASFSEQGDPLSQRPRGNQRNWNNQKSQQLGSDFVMIKKACYMDAQTQGRHEHDQEFDAEITTVGAEVDDIAAET
ncbi:hypothetical protein Tco_0248478 [Tanacetum coccineum]